MAYRTGKRAVLRIRSAERRHRRGIIVKVFRRSPTADHVNALVQLGEEVSRSSDGLVCLPPVLDVDTDKGLMLFAEVPRRTERNRLDMNRLVEAARTLAVLHQIKTVRPARTHSVHDEWETVARWVHGLAFIGGEGRARRFASRVQRLAELIPTVDPPIDTLVHRDFHCAQLLRDGRSIWLVDFDTLCRGHGEVDLGTFVAHLFLDHFRSGGSEADGLRRASDFLGTYVSRGGRVHPTSLRFYLSSALLRVGALHWARGLSAMVVDRLWTLAESLHTGRTLNTLLPVTMFS
jgi:hypothetical protein